MLTNLAKQLPKREFAFCETVHATSTSPWHIRELTDKGMMTGGGADTKALCGREVSWDVECEIEPLILIHPDVCSKCVAKYGKSKMPEYGEYHTTDPEIEKNTSQIRKQIHKTIQEIKSQGQLLENVEAFLVNNKDMDKIHQLFNDSHGVSGGPEDGQMKMYGVNIIESRYVPEGTIFKVFKNEEQMSYPASGSISSYRPDGSLIGTSGVIPNWSQPMPPGVGVPQTPDYAYQYEQDDKENVVKAIEAVNKVIDEPVPKGYVPPEEKRHSTKRRIELDE